MCFRYAQKVTRLLRYSCCLNRTKIVPFVCISSLFFTFYFVFFFVYHSSIVSLKLNVLSVFDEGNYETSTYISSKMRLLLASIINSKNKRVSAKAENRHSKKELASSCVRNISSFYADMSTHLDNPLNLIQYKVRHETYDEEGRSSDPNNNNENYTNGLFLSNSRCRNLLNEINNEQNYSLILRPKLAKCNSAKHGKKPLLLIVIMIAPDLFARRDAIRSTWANPNKAAGYSTLMDVIVLFVIGLARTTLLNEKINLEHLKYNDILQFGNFKDSYGKLTIKVLGSFWWAHRHCSTTHFILRVNDDVVVNMFSLVPFLHSVLWYKTDGNKNKSNKNYGSRIIMGNFYPNSPVYREKSNKFFVRKNEYEQDVYVPYVEGSAFIVTGNLAGEYYELSRRMYWPPFSVWFEDVYIGGFMSIYLNVSYMALQRHYSSRTQYANLNVDYVKKRVGFNNLNDKRALITSSSSTLFFIYIQQTDQIKAVWNLLSSMALSKIKKLSFNICVICYM